MYESCSADATFEGMGPLHGLMRSLMDGCPWVLGSIASPGRLRSHAIYPSLLFLLECPDLVELLLVSRDIQHRRAGAQCDTSPVYVIAHACIADLTLLSAQCPTNTPAPPSIVVQVSSNPPRIQDVVPSLSSCS